MANEFKHYPGCNHRDPDNCSACALTDTRQDAPNYAGWPLAYMENNLRVPAKWRGAFKAEMVRDDNPAYAANVKSTWERLGVTFTDGQGLNL